MGDGALTGGAGNLRVVGVVRPCLAGQIACGLVISVALRPVISIAALPVAGLSVGQMVEGIITKSLGLRVASLDSLGR